MDIITEQKALELSGLTSINDDERYYQPNKCEIYDKCLEMARWKDEQIKDKIEKFFSEHDDYDYQVNFMDNYTDMDRLEIDLINFIGL